MVGASAVLQQETDNLGRDLTLALELEDQRALARGVAHIRVGAVAKQDLQHLNHGVGRTHLRKQHEQRAHGGGGCETGSTDNDESTNNG